MWTTLYFLFGGDFSPFSIPPVLVDGQVWTSTARGLVFVSAVRPYTWGSTMPTTLTKRTGETRQYAMDFSAQPELAGTTISSVTSVVATPLVPGITNVSVTNPAVDQSGKKAVCNIAGGVDGQYYKVMFTVVVGSAVLEDFGFLLVDDDF